MADDDVEDELMKERIFGEVMEEELVVELLDVAEVDVGVLNKEFRLVAVAEVDDGGGGGLTMVDKGEEMSLYVFEDESYS